MDCQTRALGAVRLCYNSIVQARSQRLKAIDTARRITEIAADKLASDIALLDTHATCGFADYFVIVSGESERQLATLADEIVQSLKKDGVSLFRREGTAASGWLLLDYGDVIVHIFSADAREYYGLEQMWSGARVVVRIA